MRIPFDLPASWPWSIWFFIVTLIVYVLQRFPLTGVFLMIFGAAFWSVLLINAGMIGIVAEALTGRANPLWLAVPALYFGGYYTAYFHDQSTLAAVQQEVARFNKGKSLPYNGAVQDLVVTSQSDKHTSLTALTFVEKYGVPRAYDGDANVYTFGTPEVCELINSDRAFRSAGIQGGMMRPTGQGRRDKHTGSCLVMMPGQPDKPVMALVSQHRKARQGTLDLDFVDYVATDSATGASATVRTGHARPMKLFPMPVIGCALNSGSPSWNCFHGFARDRVQLVSGLARNSVGQELVARMLGLTLTDDPAATAIGIEVFQPIADRITAEASAKDLAHLERILSAPGEQNKVERLGYLADRPDIVAPYAPRIFAALEALKEAGPPRYTSGAQTLWMLVSRMSSETVGPYRSRLAALMQPPVPEYTFEAVGAYKQLDVFDPVQRAVLLDRLTVNPRSLHAELLPPFCRMGAAAPTDVKARLLGLWKARAPGPGSPNEHKYAHTDVPLYLTLARMGLKSEAGKVEQSYHGADFRIIWEHVGPETSGNICDEYKQEFRNYLREKGRKS